MGSSLPDNWKVLTVDKVKAPTDGSIAIGPFGSRMKADVYVNEGIPVIRGTNISDTKEFTGEFVYISEEMAKSLNSSNVYDGDLVFPHRGSIGEVGIVTGGKDAHYILSSSLMKLTPNHELVDPLFLFYYFRSDIGKHELLKNASQVGTPGIQTPLTSLKSLDVYVPPLPEQRAIAGILGALDDKIELNRRTNRTLESMAWAVFHELMKEARGKESTIGEAATVVGGSTPSTANPAFWDGGDIHWATPKDLSALQDPILLDTNSRITELGLQEISSGLLPVGTVLLSSRAPIGYLAITQVPVAINQGFIGIKCTEEAPNYFILNWLKDKMEEIIGRANGTTFLEISKSNFRPMKIIVPSPEKMKTFVKTVEPMYQKIVANLKESRTLASLRDSLLPKLMKGEVRVKE